MTDQTLVFVKEADDPAWGSEAHCRKIVEAFLDWELPPTHIRLEQIDDTHVAVIATGGRSRGRTYSVSHARTGELPEAHRCHKVAAYTVTLPYTAWLSQTEQHESRVRLRQAGCRQFGAPGGSPLATIARTLAIVARGILGVFQKAVRGPPAPLHISGLVVIGAKGCGGCG